MAGSVSALDYLISPADYPPRAVCALVGPEAFLTREALVRLRAAVLGGEDAEFSQTVFEGPKTQWQEVAEVLATRALFGPGRRLVVVEQADKLIENHRAELERYVQSPSKAGVLVLKAKTLPASTRLYKAIAAEGLLIDCKPPRAKQLGAWLVRWARAAHNVALAAAAANLLVELVGSQLGMLDQELARLSVLAGSGRSGITLELVRKAAGSWRSRTVWEMLDAALSGNLEAAMEHLDRLLKAGESPIGLLAQMAASLRRLAAATRVVLEAERQGRRTSLRQALVQSGVPAFALEKAERQLRRLGRERGQALSRWVTETDLGLKGASPLDSRFLLERLLVLLGGPRQQLAAAAERSLLPGR